MIEVVITAILGLIIIVIAYFKLFANQKKKAIDPEKWIGFPLVGIEKISHDVRKFRFELQTPSTALGLPIGQHISLKFVGADGKECQRSYTPVTSDDELGYVDFVIKVYYPLLPKFPDGGKMSQHLDSLKIGDTILMKGPKGHVDYKGNGSFELSRKPKQPTMIKRKKLGMIAGGTGITPMLQIIRAIIKNPKDKTEVWLIFANQTEEDILLREELESLPKDQFHLWYTLDRPPNNWKYSTGFINAEMCKDHLPPPSSDSFIFVCGPPPMIKYACEPAFKTVGFSDDNWFSF